VGEVALIILFAAGAQVGLHTYLYGEPSLNGERPPFLMARVISDGPGRWYLEQNCGRVKFAICDYVQNLPSESDDFIWGENGIWQNASEETADRLRQEEFPFVLATLRAYPRAQIFKSLSNFGEQLTKFGFELDANAWMLKEFDNVFPSGRSHYLQSRQAQDEIPFGFFVVVQYCAVIASVGVIAAFAFLIWRYRTPRIIGLGMVTMLTVIANAFVTGALSMVEDRYESRVIWLVPLLACVLVMSWRELRKSPTH
jgi:nitrate reductase NapE component